MNPEPVNTEPMTTAPIHQQPSLRVHAAVTAASLVAVFAVNLVVNLNAGLIGQLGAWWTLWAALGCGIGLAIHALLLWLQVAD